MRSAELDPGLAAIATGFRLEDTPRILEAISDPFAVYARDWRVLFANAASTKGLGRSPAEVIGRKIWELAPELVGTRVHSELSRAMESGTAVTFEDQVEGHWWEVNAYPIRELGLAVYARDVTGRKSATSLTARLAQYGELRAAVAMALSSHRALKDMLQDCCEALVRHLKVSFARVWLVDAVGEALELQASAGKYTHIDGPHRRVPIGAFKIGKIASERKPHLTNDVQNDDRVGNREWARTEGMVAFAGYPLIVDGRVIGVMAAFATETLPEDTLAAIGGIGEAIAQGVERRRAEIDLEVHARDLARSNADLEQFAYVASHDLQEPLRMVASYVQLLERRYKDKLDGDAHDFIGFAVEGATRMRRLIDDLLMYSRVGRRETEPTEIELSAVLGTVEKHLEHAIAESGAIVTHGPLPKVLIVETQLVQVLQNLIGNAIKFRREEAPRVHVTARREGSDWTVSVKDNGIGIDAAYFERIFVIFQRLNARERYAGTGIGLAITKKLVERQGGRIWVESVPGEGSTVSFTIPVNPRARRSHP